jgi:serine/threonine protein kinase/WD40 repeat protein
MTEQSPAEAIFFAALEKGTAEQRAAYLDAACGDDRNLRRRVERLLATHPQVGSFLEAPAQDEVALAEAPTIPPGENSPSAPGRADTSSYHGRSEAAGAIIAGRYKLVEKIGEGGMGAVWVAQQTEPVKRAVAVKLIKAGMDSKAVLARFEAERQALALMDHPNIARVLDGGATPDGQPFFVMELVKGVPITHFCDARKLTPRQRLELFVPVCQAIQHAHQKGVIHRDIKPSNILIALYDDRPVPKVIDFGVAKATGQTLTDKSLMTGFGAVVGTPEYMSPEQASLNNLDIDTRSDVYSLGVLLYELLAGSPPFHGEELQKAGLIEMLRMVCEEEPPRPSIKLSTAHQRASISANRGTEPKTLTGLLRNELDWIVMKALEKDRARRYETVNGFAADVQRYLAGEAVQAHPPSAAYRLRKFARKHRVALTTAAAFAGLLIAAAVVSSWLAVKANHAEALADEKRIEAETNAKAAKENADLFHKEAIDNIAARVEAEITASSLQIDLDLSELRTDPKVGLLRLARPLKQNLESRGRKLTLFDPTTGQPFVGGTLEVDDNRGNYKALREFVAAAVLTSGQDYAPLLPPIAHDGQEVVHTSLSPDKQTLLTFGMDSTARLWDARTARQIAVLRQGEEKVINCGFSPDGRTVFTDDQTSVARFWDVPSGRFRAATVARPNRYMARDNVLSALLRLHDGHAVATSHFQHMGAAHIGATRLLTQRIVEKMSGNPGSPGGSALTPEGEGPLELWDIATGRLVSKLDVPGGAAVYWAQFLGDWVEIQVKDGGTLLLFSAENGRPLGRVPRPIDEALEYIDASPNGRQLATVHGKGQGDNLGTFENYVLRVWDVATGQVRSSTTMPSTVDISRIRYWMDDAFDGGESVVALGGDKGWTVFRVGRDEPIAEFPGVMAVPDLLGRAGNLVHGGNGGVYDSRTWQRLYPPPGRKFHPDLAKFAVDGRFVRAAINSELVVIDTPTDKVLPTEVEWNDLPGFGMIAVTTLYDRTTIGLLPTSRLDIPPDLLELWAQVAVRGELGPDGQFVPWDEGKWEQKRQELAARPVPSSDFPFPGYVAQDRLHWLRQEYQHAKDTDKPRLAKQLLDRAEVIGDKAEAVRWRAVLGADTEAPLQPPPK